VAPVRFDRAIDAVGKIHFVSLTWQSHESVQESECGLERVAQVGPRSYFGRLQNWSIGPLFLASRPLRRVAGPKHKETKQKCSRIMLAERADERGPCLRRALTGSPNSYPLPSIDFGFSYGGLLLHVLGLSLASIGERQAPL
jgi:hypothetical protein